MAEIFESVIHTVAFYGGSILEACGIVVLLCYAAITITGMVTGKRHAEFSLTRGISLALEFLLAGEVLHTIIAEDTSDLIMLGALVVLRAIMTIEIHFEMKHHEHELHDESEKAKEN